MTPTDAASESAPEAPIAFQIWKSHRAANSWVRAGVFTSGEAAARAVPNFGRAPGWLILPTYHRTKPSDKSE